MSEDLQQAQIDELRDRISDLELLLGLASTLIALTSLRGPNEIICGDYAKLLEEVLAQKSRTKRLRIDPALYPSLASFIAKLRTPLPTNVDLS